MSIGLLYYRESVTIELVGPRNSERVVDVEYEDGRLWRVVVTSQGELDQIETTKRDGELANLDEPEWLDELFEQLARAA